MHSIFIFCKKVILYGFVSVGYLWIFHRVDHQKTHELLDLMTDHVEATQNVDDEIEELVKLGFSERAKEIYYVAYGSPEARYMLAH